MMDECFRQSYVLRDGVSFVLMVVQLLLRELEEEQEGSVASSINFIDALFIDRV